MLPRRTLGLWRQQGHLMLPRRTPRRRQEARRAEIPARSGMQRLEWPCRCRTFRREFLLGRRALPAMPRQVEGHRRRRFPLQQQHQQQKQGQQEQGSQQQERSRRLEV